MLKTVYIHQASISPPNGRLWMCKASVDTVDYTVKEPQQL